MAMHPELLNNTFFLRYYKQWQDDPSSIVFAPISEYFLHYGMIDDALKVCREGIKRHPAFVSGRIVMAKIHLKRGNWDEAEDNLKLALSVMPTNIAARELLSDIEASRCGDVAHSGGNISARAFVPESKETIAHDPSAAMSPDWNTVTMAGIYVSQGHFEKARGIYEAILKSDPGNEAARRGLESLSQSGGTVSIQDVRTHTI